jgi:hypothetical protein
MTASCRRPSERPYDHIATGTNRHRRHKQEATTIDVTILYRLCPPCQVFARPTDPVYDSLQMSQVDVRNGESDLSGDRDATEYSHLDQPAV